MPNILKGSVHLAAQITGQIVLETLKKWNYS
jgi:hypothetical protein